VRLPAAALLTLFAANGLAATAYVTDELVLGVYADQKGDGPRLTTLHSGAVVDTIAVNGDTTQVRLADGTLGWVKSTYLTSSEPAVVRIKQLQDELDRAQATTPELAEAAERSEVARLRRELAEALSASSAAAHDAGPGGFISAAPATQGAGAAVWGWIAAVAAALCGGTWLGYSILARRIRDKFGGIKVY
jgi:hypothetical protein